MSGRSFPDKREIVCGGQQCWSRARGFSEFRIENPLLRIACFGHNVQCIFQDRLAYPHTLSSLGRAPLPPLLLQSVPGSRNSHTRLRSVQQRRLWQLDLPTLLHSWPFAWGGGADEQRRFGIPPTGTQYRGGLFCDANSDMPGSNALAPLFQARCTSLPLLSRASEQAGRGSAPTCKWPRPGKRSRFRQGP